MQGDNLRPSEKGDIAYKLLVWHLKKNGAKLHDIVPEPGKIGQEIGVPPEDLLVFVGMVWADMGKP